jgi:tetratricopeptide (TPR) repeat protein
MYDYNTEQEPSSLEYGIPSDMCCICGSNRINHSDNPHSILCRECQETHLRLPIPLWVKIFFALVLAATVFMAAQLPGFFDTYKTYQSAEQLLSERMYSPAMWKYIEVLEEYENVSLAMNAIEAAIGAQHFEIASYLFYNYLVGKNLNDAQYDRAIYLDSFLDRYFETIELVEDLGYKYGEDLEKYQAELLLLLERNDIDKARVNFLLYLISEDAEIRMEYVRLASTLDELVTYPIAFYGNELRRIGDYAAALEVYNKALERNAYDTYAMRGIGILMQIQGDTAGGLHVIADAYEKNPYELYIYDALIIALWENGEKEAAMEIMETAKAEEYEFQQDLYDYLDGKITMVEYYS